jgi:hypothetical protein
MRFGIWNVKRVFIGKGKGKVIPLLLFSPEYNAMTAYWGNEGIAPCILNLGIRWR